MAQILGNPTTAQIVISMFLQHNAYTAPATAAQLISAADRLRIVINLYGVVNVWNAILVTGSYEEQIATTYTLPLFLQSIDHKYITSATNIVTQEPNADSRQLINDLMSLQGCTTTTDSLGRTLLVPSGKYAFSNVYELLYNTNICNFSNLNGFAQPDDCGDLSDIIQWKNVNNGVSAASNPTSWSASNPYRVIPDADLGLLVRLYDMYIPTILNSVNKQNQLALFRGLMVKTVNQSTSIESYNIASSISTSPLSGAALTSNNVVTNVYVASSVTTILSLINVASVSPLSVSSFPSVGYTWGNKSYTVSSLNLGSSVSVTLENINSDQVTVGHPIRFLASSLSVSPAPASYVTVNVSSVNVNSVNSANLDVGLSGPNVSSLSSSNAQFAQPEQILSVNGNDVGHGAYNASEAFDIYDNMIKTKNVGNYKAANVTLEMMLLKQKLLPSLVSVYYPNYPSLTSTVNSVVNDVFNFVQNQFDKDHSQIPSISIPSNAKSTMYVFFSVLKSMGFTSKQLLGVQSGPGFVNGALGSIIPRITSTELAPTNLYDNKVPAAQSDFDLVFGVDTVTGEDVSLSTGTLTGSLLQRLSNWGQSSIPVFTNLKPTDNAALVAQCIFENSGTGKQFTPIVPVNEKQTFSGSRLTIAGKVYTNSSISNSVPASITGSNASSYATYASAMLTALSLGQSAGLPAPYGWNQFIYADPSSNLTYLSQSVQQFASMYSLDFTNPSTLYSMIVPTLVNTSTSSKVAAVDFVTGWGVPGSSPQVPTPNFLSGTNKALIIEALLRQTHNNNDDIASLNLTILTNGLSTTDYKSAYELVISLINSNSVSSVLNTPKGPWSNGIPPAVYYLKYVLSNQVSLSNFASFAQSSPSSLGLAQTAYAARSDDSIYNGSDETKNYLGLHDYERALFVRRWMREQQNSALGWSILSKANAATSQNNFTLKTDEVTKIAEVQKAMNIDDSEYVLEYSYFLQNVGNFNDIFKQFVVTGCSYKTIPPGTRLPVLPDDTNQPVESSVTKTNPLRSYDNVAYGSVSTPLITYRAQILPSSPSLTAGDVWFYIVNSKVGQLNLTKLAEVLNKDYVYCAILFTHIKVQEQYSLARGFTGVKTVKLVFDEDDVKTAFNLSDAQVKNALSEAGYNVVA